MLIADVIEPFYFFLALGIGFFLVYAFTPAPDIIIKYPTPENAGKVTYRDSNDVCYTYAASRVSCPSDLSRVKEIPMEHQEKEESGFLRMFGFSR